MESKGMDRSQLAIALGITYQAVRKVFEANGAFGSKNNLKAADLFGVNPTWLATGSGEMFARDYRITAEAGKYELKPQIDPAPAQPGQASPTAMELAFLYDLIPVTDQIRRSKAYAAAVAAILGVLEGQATNDQNAPAAGN